MCTARWVIDTGLYCQAVARVVTIDVSLKGADARDSNNRRKAPLMGRCRLMTAHQSRDMCCKVDDT